MASRSPLLLLVSGISWRLEQVEEALGRLRKGLSQQQVPKITLGYASRLDRLVIVLEAGPAMGEHVGPVAVAEAQLEGLRVVQLAGGGDPVARALAGCDPVFELDGAAPAVARLRRPAPASAPAVPPTGPGRRLEPRVRSQLEVVFTTGAQVAKEYTENVSRGGVFVRTDHPPQRGAGVDLTLRLPGGEVLELAAEVVHVMSPDEARAAGAVPGCGLAFTTLTPDQRERLEAYVRVKLSAPAAPVLLVSSQAGFRRDLALALGSRGHTVMEAGTLASGWLRFAEHQLELRMIVCELDLSDGSGEELLSRVRTVAGEADIRFVIVGAAEPERRRALLLAGADDVLPSSLAPASIADRAGELEPPRG